MERAVRLWVHGIALTIIFAVVTTIFAVFGLTFTFAVLGESFTSVGALAFAFTLIIVLPLIYGWVSRQLSDLLHEGVSPTSLDDAGDWIMLWLHGLGLAVVIVLIATLFGFFGLTLSLATLASALTNIGALVFAIISFTVLPIMYGFVSQGLTELTA